MTSRISLIFDPPLPIRDPHCEAGTIKRKVIGGLGTVAGDTKLAKSCKQKPLTFSFCSPTYLKVGYHKGLGVFELLLEFFRLIRDQQLLSFCKTNS